MPLFILPSPSPAAPTEVRIGVLAYRGKEAADAKWSETASFLTKKIPRHSFRIVPLDFDEIGPAVGAGEVDFVVTNPEIYVELEARYGVTRIATLKNKTENGPFTVFGGVIFTRADRTDIRDLNDLKGKKFMGVDETSLGGWTMAWRELEANGIRPYRDFTELSFGQTHDAVVYAVLSGSADAGTVRSDTLERMRDEGKIDLRRFRILHERKVENFPFALSTRLYPEWPFAKVRHTQDVLAQSALIALMSMRNDDPAATSASIEGWTIPLDYQPVHELMRELKLGPFRDYGKVSLSSAILQHWRWFLLVLFALLLMTLVTVYVIRLNQVLRQRTSELVRAKESADAANRAKSVFLSNMSHELRTPLNAVLGYSRMMKSAPEATKEQKENLGIITRSGEHLLNLINNVLDISKIEAGRVELEEADVDLHHLMQEMHSLMHIRADEKGIGFTTTLSPGLPRAVRVDDGKLRQVLINLIGNAIKYTAKGSVSVRTDAAGEETPQRIRVRFEIEDSGPGIRHEDRERIFLPFVQLESRTSTEPGSGLGLAISKQYVELMGGHIGVDCETEKGCLFHFEIPAAISGLQNVRTALRQARVTGLAARQPQYKILIVEDQPENLLLHKLLEPLGLEVREALNGQEAVALSEQWRPHLIWMDIRMPVMDGIEATRRIKTAGNSPVPKIIAVTAHALEEERREILAAGCDDFVRKPYREAEIFGMLARHLGLKYKYADEQNPEERNRAVVKPEQLSALPADLRKKLYQAVVELDTARTLALIEKVAESDAATGTALEALAKSLDYDRLLRLLESDELVSS